MGKLLPIDEPLSKALKNEIAVKQPDSSHLQIWIPILDEAEKVKQVVFVNRNISTQIKMIRYIQWMGVLIILVIFLLLYFSLRQVFLRSTQNINKLAYHDPLTDLPNRRLFMNHLHFVFDETKQKGYMSAIMYIDIDRFKNINDTLGHNVGDCLLKAVGERLTESVRRQDMIARIGGDEFTVLLSLIDDVGDTIKIAEKIVDVFKQPFKLEGHELYVSPSIGIAIYPDHGHDPETLIKRADTAMYYAKEQRKNKYQIYAEKMDSQALERLNLENGLRKALNQNDFQLYYQPKVDIRSGQIIGMETLVRWHHPELGMISPAKFIPIAEETGFIVPLGEWILRMACKQNKKWQDAGYPPLQIAVNLSARQFKQDNFIQVISDILQETELEAKWLELEITESTIMDHVDDAVLKLDKLRTMGIRMSIDDFGTGYSSLSYLKSLPIDTLKIDHSFVRDIPFHADDMAIVKSIISMANALNLHVIAEGVETEEQMLFLHENGCYEGQGYLFHKPIPAEEFEKVMKENKKSAGDKIKINRVQQ
jgi:diguanylate cyclase (GGDEF)-like protein